MTTQIEIPEYLLPFFPESVPILDEDEIWKPGNSRDDVIRSVFDWEEFIFTNESVLEFVSKNINEEWNAQLDEVRQCRRESIERSEIWNNIMARLGYTEVIPDNR